MKNPIISKKDIKKFANKNFIFEIVWADVFAEQRIEKSDLPECPLSEQLVLSHTYGKLAKVNSGCIEIFQEDSASSVDRTVIPLCLVREINLLGGN